MIALRCSLTLALLAGAVLAQAPADTARSTGQVERVLEPAPPPAPSRLELPAGQPALVHSGEVSAAATAHFVVATPAGRMIEIRIASPDKDAALSIHRGDASEPEAGTARESGAVGWISSTEEGGDLRVVVWTTNGEKSPFRLLVRVHPPEATEPAETGSASAEE
jgi:hypothetical protein